MNLPLYFVCAAAVGMAGALHLRAQDFSDPADILRYQAQSKPIEGDGTIRGATTNKPGWYLVTMDGLDGKGFNVLLTPATKYWEHDQPLDAEKAYTKIAQGQKVRFLHKPAFDAALHRTWACDLMFVEKFGAANPSNTGTAATGGQANGGGKPVENPLAGLVKETPTKLVHGGAGDGGTGAVKPFESGWYYLQSQVSHLNLDVSHGNRDNGGTLCQAKSNKAQVWRFVPAGDGFDFVQSHVSGLNLDVRGRNKTDGGDVCQAKQDAVQCWKLIPASDGAYYLQSRVSGLFLTVDKKNAEVGGRVCQGKQDAAQTWKLIAEPNPLPPPAAPAPR